MTAQRGVGSALVAWTAPSSNGGSAITSYRVTPWLGVAAQTATVVGPSAMSTTVGGLTNGLTYTFTVAATNAVGTGSESGASNAVKPEQAAATYSLSGTVNYSGSKAGRVFIVVLDSPDDLRQVLGGTSIASAPGSFTIRGLQRTGSLTLFAFLDSVGRWVHVGGVTPSAYASVSASGSDVTGVTVNLMDPAPSAPGPATNVFPFSTTDAAFVSFAFPTDATGAPTATRVRAELLPQGQSTPTATVDVPVNADQSASFTGLAPGSYSVRLTANNASGDSTPVSSSTFVVGPGTGGYSISGAVDRGGWPSGGVLYVYAYSEALGIFLTTIGAPSAVQSFTIPNVPSGHYWVGASLDLAGDGVLDVTDPNAWVSPTAGAVVTVAGANVTGRALALRSGDASVTLRTRRSDDDWSLDFEATSLTKVPVAAQIVAGPQLLPPIDQGLVLGDRGGSVRLAREVRLAPSQSPPLPGERYTVELTFADGGTSTADAVVTGALTAPTPVAPVGAATSTTPTFSWTPPSSLPANPAMLTVDLARSSGGRSVWFSGPLPISATSIAYNANGTATESPALTGSRYDWWLGLEDQYGNRAWRRSTFTMPVSVVVVPATSSLATSQTQRFAAVLAGAVDPTVTWSVSPAGAGTIGPDGLFTPLMSGAATVTATSNQSPTAFGTASVSVGSTPQLNVSVSPALATLAPSAGQSFAATVTNASDPTVTWSVAEPGCGTINASGAYTAPSQPDLICHVVASSNQSGAVKGVAEVAVPRPSIPVSGTVTYGGGASGRIFISVRTYGGTGQLTFGTSLSAAGAFSFGAQLQDGTYVLEAFRDTLGTGRYSVTADPFGSTPLVVSGGVAQTTTLALVDPAPGSPGTVSNASAGGGADLVWVRFSPITSPQGAEIPSKYRIYVSTSSSFPNDASTRTLDVVPGYRAPAAMVTGLAPGGYYAAVSAFYGAAEGAKRLAGGPHLVGGSAPPNSLDGVVTAVDGTPGGPLYVWAEGAGTYFLRVGSPSYPQAYSLKVGSGTWVVRAFADTDGDGIAGPKDPTLLEQSEGATVTVAGAANPVPDLRLSGAAASASVKVFRYVRPYSSGYAHELSASAGTKLPVKVALWSAARLGSPLDLGISPYGDNPSNDTPGPLRTRAAVDLFGLTPVQGDPYSLHVEFADASTADYVRNLQPFFRVPPAIGGPSGAIASTTPTFSWTPNSTASQLRLQVRRQYGQFVWGRVLPGTAASVVFNDDGNASEPLMSGSAYDWTLEEVTPATGNSTLVETRFTVQ